MNAKALGPLRTIGRDRKLVLLEELRANASATHQGQGLLPDQNDRAWLKSAGLELQGAVLFAYADLPSGKDADTELDARRRALMRSLRKQGSLRAVLAALEGARIRPVVYKGGALAHGAYRDPSMRPMADLDLWFPCGQILSALKVLELEGFVRQRPRSERPPPWQRCFGGEIQLRHRQLGVVELHYDVFPGVWLFRAARIDREAVKSRVQATKLLGLPAGQLAPRDHLVQVALHAGISNRHSIDCLRGLLDIALLSEQVDDWDALVADAKRWRVSRALSHAFSLSGAAFGVPELTDAAGRLDSGVGKKLLELHLNSQNVLSGTSLTQSWKRWSYLLCATDRPSSALSILLQTLWPVPAWLQMRFGHPGMKSRLAWYRSLISGDL